MKPYFEALLNFFNQLFSKKNASIATFNKERSAGELTLADKQAEIDRIEAKREIDRQIVNSIQMDEPEKLTKLLKAGYFLEKDHVQSLLALRPCWISGEDDKKLTSTLLKHLMHCNQKDLVQIYSKPLRWTDHHQIPKADELIGMLKNYSFETQDFRFLSEKERDLKISRLILRHFSVLFVGQYVCQLGWTNILSKTKEQLETAKNFVTREYTVGFKVPNQWGRLIIEYEANLKQLNDEDEIFRTSTNQITSMYAFENNKPPNTSLSQATSVIQEVSNESSGQNEKNVNTAVLVSQSDIDQLSPRAQKELGEIEVIVTALQSVEHAQDRHKIDSITKETLPTAVAQYISVHPTYRPLLKTDAGQTVDDLLVDSLREMKLTLDEIFKATETQKMKALSSTHRYLKASK